MLRMAGEQKKKKQAWKAKIRKQQQNTQRRKTHTDIHTFNKKKKKATWQNTGGSDLTEDDKLKHVSQ